MERNIKLYYNVGRYTDSSKYTNIDEDVEFLVNYEKPSGALMYFCANNGSSTKKGLILNNKFTLPATFIKLGKISIKISIEVLGEIVKTFNVEDLLVNELNGEIIAIPQMVDHENRIQELEKDIRDLRTKLNLFIKLWKEEL